MEQQSDDMRVGHDERDAAAAILQKAAAEGRLTLEELDERLEAALQAKTYGQLRPLIADLTTDGPPAATGGALSPVLWGANTDRLSKSWGSKSIKVPSVAAPGKPLLVIFGGLGIGSLKVRPPRNRDLRRIGRLGSAYR